MGKRKEQKDSPQAESRKPPVDTLNEIGVIKRREIEARILAPLLTALAEEFDRERVLEIARQTIIQLARQQGSQLAIRMGGNGLEQFAGTLEDWKRGDAMEIEVLEQTSQRFSFNVTRCGYAEMYRALGVPELGELLSCNRDFSLITGFNPDIRLSRTQTIMQGAPFCDFRFVMGQAQGIAHGAAHEEVGVKTLLIMRHAKSAWDQEDTPDHDRPLNKRGKHDAPRMGDLLKAEDLLPDLIISSTAKRARTTVELVAEASDYGGEVRWEESLYAAGPEAYIAILRTLPDDLGSVMVVGHNPGLEELVAMLSDEWASLPTAALAQVRLNIPKWADLGYEPVGKLAHVWRPKELAG